MARIHATAHKSTLALRQRKRFLVSQLEVFPDCLRASFVERFARCGKANCHCHHGGDKHGPFYFLTQCLAVGKINKFLLPTSSQRQAAQEGIAHYRQLQEQIEELSQINAELLRRGGGRSKVNNADFSQLSQFVHYAQKRFDLSLLAGSFADSRPEPQIPSRSVWLSLILGEVVHIPSFLQLQEETKLPQWQEWVGHPAPISHDTFGYVAERLDPAQLRRGARWINQKLKRGKAFEANKLKGLLVLSVDANEEFCSDRRCCDRCMSREITCKDGQGHEVKKTQWFHKQVYAQLSGPQLSVIVDFEPMRQGEEECGAALRLLRRMRREHGPRFFDVVTVDSWYANGPFVKTVVDELGWPVVAVLKQERYEIHQEALTLSAGKKPGQVVERNGRQVQIWDVPALRLSDSYIDPVRVVRVRERWTQRQRVGGEWRNVEKEENWLWVVAGDLEACDGAAIRDIGHFRWKIENNAFGELTQHWHLTHCAHHHPVAVEALLWIKIIAFTLFHAFAILHGKLLRLGKATLQEVRKQLYRSLLCGSPIRFFSG